MESRHCSVGEEEKEEEEAEGPASIASHCTAPGQSQSVRHYLKFMNGSLSSGIRPCVPIPPPTL